MHEIEYSIQAKKFLKKLDKKIAERIYNKIGNLKNNPVPNDAKFIERDKFKDKIFRYRIGNYRALYKLKEKIILISKIDKRPRVYRK
ncbi:type II toxin-antitoxin system RelE/ParE family toxin [Candidatus Pacearchaeota archaeon]|nr:MAG: type II toxin-antitoxin system RelE/ParE family toxin [Candidatus Pacearchaeota archaeon]